MDRLGLALIALFNAACLAFFGFTNGPGLLNDAPLLFAQKVQAEGEADANCRVYGGLFQACEVNIRIPTVETRDGIEYQSQYDGLREGAFFLGFGPPGHREGVMALAAANDPTHLTTSFSLNNFISRLLTFLVFELIFLIMFLVTLSGVFAPSESRRNP